MKPRYAHRELLWEDLCDAARRLGLEIRHEPLAEECWIEGGLVRLGKRRLLLVDARLSLDRKNQILRRILRDWGIEGIYLPPSLRSWLDSQDE